MSKARIAINGFGRTGRCLTRQLYRHPSLELVAINSRFSITPDMSMAAYLLAHDSVYGLWEQQVAFKEKEASSPERKKPQKNYWLEINGKDKIPLFKGTHPLAQPWEELGIDIVIDTTGNFPRVKESADGHLEAGAKNVVLTYPPTDENVKTIMAGVNDDIYDASKDRIVFGGSCTALAIAPIIKYVNLQWGIERARVVGVHAYTASQNLLDNRNKDKRRARGGAQNIIPTTTGAEENIASIFPDLEKRIAFSTYRVPVPICCCLDIDFLLKKETAEKDVAGYFSQLAQDKSTRKIIGVCNWPAVSSDIKGDAHNAVIDEELTAVTKNDEGRTHLHMVAWFDNEWGYCARLISLLEYIAAKNKKKWF